MFANHNQQEFNGLFHTEIFRRRQLHRVSCDVLISHLLISSHINILSIRHACIGNLRIAGRQRGWNTA